MYSPPRPGRGTRKQIDRTEQDKEDLAFFQARLQHWQKQLDELPPVGMRLRKEEVQAQMLVREIKRYERKIAQFKQA